MADIADALGEDGRAVWVALHQLNKSKLLVEEIALQPDMRNGPRPNSRVTSRQIGFGSILESIQAGEEPDF